MNLELQSLSHPSLIWEKILPPDFTGVRLPGGDLSSATGDFGTICIQEFKSDNYSIRYHVLHTLQKFILKIKTTQQGIYSQLVLHGEVYRQVNNRPDSLLKRNQFYAANTASHEFVASFKEKNIYHGFDTFFSSNLVSDVIEGFPSLQKNLQSISTHDMKHGVWADAETLEHAQSILRCKYKKDLRSHFYNSRVRDLLFKYLVQLNEPDLLKKQPAEKDIDAVYKAENIIKADITKHILIPDLSKMVLLNEFRLKAVFKKIFGMGPYEYLVRQRMKKAKSLLESGFSVKEVAAQTGYRPSDFTTAFVNHYGFTPSSVKKKSL
jgi:AraC-like DNA-binding protein